MRSQSQRALRERSESTQRAIREQSESNQRAIREQSESNQLALRASKSESIQSEPLNTASCSFILVDFLWPHLAHVAETQVEVVHQGGVGGVIPHGQAVAAGHT